MAKCVKYDTLGFSIRDLFVIFSLPSTISCTISGRSFLILWPIDPLLNGDSVNSDRFWAMAW
jgi:hypothetical protein